MADSPKTNAPLGGVFVDLADGLEATNKNTEQQQFSTDAAILASKSTAIDTQLAKVLVLLRRGPKNTLELRTHGILMPAARVHTLRHDHKLNIVTDLVTLYDAEGIRHNQCARYHLIEDVAGEVSQ